MSKAIEICEISTHSLTKRLTQKEGDGDCWVDISTHSLTKRLTIPLFFIAVFRYFNSQPHEEADR